MSSKALFVLPRTVKHLVSFLLFKINLKLWKIEDDLRDHERKKIFNQNFIELARGVYFNNDKRAKLKNEINEILKSNIREIKQYDNYKI